MSHHFDTVIDPTLDITDAYCFAGASAIRVTPMMISTATAISRPARSLGIWIARTAITAMATQGSSLASSIRPGCRGIDSVLLRRSQTLGAPRSDLASQIEAIGMFAQKSGSIWRPACRCISKSSP